ncbi:hypothetical protein BWI96_10360 [Siphonobacter sp. SORGH_AS_0500]|uniref:hypothetical protein n=1 Tax=Siphonobacter sp. SORGH_AS_0500 TaxID=1864824 RepID=UPI000CCA84DD|nr:hypothetical protein [Siphonobacter sp. SORGH_AS_0500]PKK36764.1 hypothetical protein BWI96_10360 [Siphonobacter sp. SORGH_AS_0500]
MNSLVDKNLFIDQYALSVIAPIDENKLADLRVLLSKIQANIDQNDSILPFVNIEGLHFARFVILTSYTNKNGKVIPDQLVYSCNCDIGLDDHLKQISLSNALLGFYQIFSCCREFDSSRRDGESIETIKEFMIRFKVDINTFYRGHRGFAVKQIKDEDAIRSEIQKYLDKNIFDKTPLNQIKSNLDKHILEMFPTWKPPIDIRLKYISFGGVIFRYIALPLLLFIIIVSFLSYFFSFWILLITLVNLLLIALYLRFIEFNADSISDKIDSSFYDKIKDLTASEDRIVQNQLTHLVDLRPGIFRKFLQKIALWTLNKLATYTFNKGRLGDIATIHFARWIMIDSDERLLFFSNFDGSWENYLGDFVDRAALGLTLAWSNTNEFPKTKWLVMKGAEDEERFKTWTRKYQIPTQVWFSGYRDLTVKNILRNRSIALGIYKSMSDQELVEWFNLL